MYYFLRGFLTQNEISIKSYHDYGVSCLPPTNIGGRVVYHRRVSSQKESRKDSPTYTTDIRQ